MASNANGVKIAEAATQLGVASHVLRHWEDVGVLVPDRSGGGHRLYDQDLLTRARLIQRCQRADMTLAEIVELFSARPRSRQAALLALKQAQLQTAVDDLRATVDFLGHVLDCRHSLVSECPECVGFSHANRTRRLDAAAARRPENT